MKSFFALPLEDKLAIENKRSPHLKGYSPLLSGNNDPNNKGDLQEGFEFGFEPLTSTDPNEACSYMGQNVWPASLPSFRKAALEYYHEALKVGNILFPLFALALGLDEHWFDDKTKGSAALMRLLYYPPQPVPQEKVVGIGAHTDWECFTILYQQTDPPHTALQVLNPDVSAREEQEWIDVPPIEGTLVINLGDQFARWTNDTFKSTLHRAVNNRSRGEGRYSVPLFFGTDYDVKLEPIPGFVSPDHPFKYDIVTAGEYVQRKLKETYNVVHQ